MHGRFLLPLIAASALAAIAGSASAIPFKITGGSATPSGITVGSTVDVDAFPGGLPVLEPGGVAGEFDLDVGETTERFDFLQVTVTGIGLTTGVIDAEIHFSQPTTATAEGILAGFSVILGWASGGVLTVLHDPGPIAFGDGGLFDVNFFGFSDSCQYCTTLSGTVQATVSLLSAPRSTSVPEPATLTLLGAGLAALGFSRRRRRA